MVSPLNTFLTASYASSMVNALFAPLSSQDIGTATTSTKATPSVSTASSSSDKVTSAAIAAIQALVKGGTPASSASTAASAAAQGSQSLPDWYTATGTTTFTPLNSTKSVIMPTDEYLWYKDGMPQTLDGLKAQFYDENRVDNLNTLLDQATSRGDQTGTAYWTSLISAVKSGTVQFSLLDSSVSCQTNASVIRDGGGHIIGNSLGGNVDWEAVNKVYNDSNQNYLIGSNPFIDGYVISWPKS